MTDLINQTLLNRYHIRTQIGRGGMAEVYQVWDRHRAATLTIKVLHEDMAFDRVFLRRFQREPTPQTDIYTLGIVLYEYPLQKIG